MFMRRTCYNLRMKKALPIIFLIFFLTGCRAGGVAGTPAPTPGSTVGPAVATPQQAQYQLTLASLASAQWVDIYDSSFVLTFSATNLTMTETNQLAGTKNVYSVTIAENVLEFRNALGAVTSTVPISLDDNLLTISYDNQTGPLTYKPHNGAAP